MKLLYITFSSVDKPKYCGVTKKIFSQIDALNGFGYKAHLLSFKGDFFDEICLFNSKKEIIRKFNLNSNERKNPFLRRKKYFKVTEDILSELNYDILYIRYPLSDLIFLNFLKKIKFESNKIILDIPTYPFYSEFKNFRGFLKKTTDFLTHSYLKKYINMITTPYYEKNIFGIKTLIITNGIDVESIKLRNLTEFDDRNLEMIVVANINFWHGIDRVIYGIYNYKGRYNISLNVVGLGNELNNLKELTKKLNLERKVTFHGFKEGAELDELFEKSHVAIGNLKGFAKKLKTISDLKTREYCARGIPFIRESLKDMDFGDDFEYALKIPSNEGPIEIASVIDFVKTIYRDPDYPAKMREYSLKNLDWKVKMKKLKDFLDSVQH